MDSKTVRKLEEELEKPILEVSFDLSNEYAVALEMSEKRRA